MTIKLSSINGDLDQRIQSTDLDGVYGNLQSTKSTWMLGNLCLSGESKLGANLKTDTTQMLLSKLNGTNLITISGSNIRKGMETLGKMASSLLCTEILLQTV